MMFWDNNKNCWIGNEFYLSKSRIRFFNYFCNKACPTGLVRSANPSAIISVETFIKQYMALKIFIVIEQIVLAIQ
jgi:NADPH-dependent glutamate synthase beta subunit-like oxidoreductase